MYELKIYREVMCQDNEVMCQDNEEWYKNWRGTNLSFQNWHEELHKFWPSVWKSKKFEVLIGSSMGSFWAKYILLELKKYREVTFHETKEWYKI